MTTAALVLFAVLILVFSPIRVIAFFLLITLVISNPLPGGITVILLGILFYLYKFKLR